MGFREKIQTAVASIGTSSREVTLRQIENQFRKSRRTYIQKGTLPLMTNEECEAQITKESTDNWRSLGAFYERVGITLQDFIEAGKRGINNQTTPVEELPKPVEMLVERVGRNMQCPCGSGKKYKRCCMGRE